MTGGNNKCVLLALCKAADCSSPAAIFFQHQKLFCWEPGHKGPHIAGFMEAKPPDSHQGDTATNDQVNTHTSAAQHSWLAGRVIDSHIEACRKQPRVSEAWSLICLITPCLKPHTTCPPQLVGAGVADCAAPAAGFVCLQADLLLMLWILQNMDAMCVDTQQTRRLIVFTTCIGPADRRGV